MRCRGVIRYHFYYENLVAQTNRPWFRLPVMAALSENRAG
jgi:hypothetical protein